MSNKYVLSNEFYHFTYKLREDGGGINIGVILLLPSAIRDSTCLPMGIRGCEDVGVTSWTSLIGSGANFDWSADWSGVASFSTTIGIDGTKGFSLMTRTGWSEA